jgi:anti-anti-sigma factor
MWTRLESERVEPVVSGLIIYRLSGSLSYGPDADNLVERIREDSKNGRTRVALNLSDLSRIDSGGIGLLCAACASIHNAGGRMQLVGLPERYRGLFKMLGLSGLFHLVESEEDLATDADAKES